MSRLERAETRGIAFQNISRSLLRKASSHPANRVGSPTGAEGHLLIVTFFRSRWCPYCMTELEAWHADFPTIREHGAILTPAPISPTPSPSPTRSRSTSGSVHRPRRAEQTARSPSFRSLRRLRGRWSRWRSLHRRSDFQIRLRAACGLACLRSGG